jgi:hypothetical protein
VFHYSCPEPFPKLDSYNFLASSRTKTVNGEKPYRYDHSGNKKTPFEYIRKDNHKQDDLEYDLEHVNEKAVRSMRICSTQTQCGDQSCSIRRLRFRRVSYLTRYTLRTTQRTLV